MQVLLVDLSSVLYPIWHVSGSDPDPDHVSTATVAQVRALASRWSQTRTIVCCDARRNFRKELCREYKAQRDSKPEALIYQMNRTKEILSDIDGLLVLTVEGFEADDLVASCVMKLSDICDVSRLVVATNDKDLAQLVKAPDPDGRFPGVSIYSLTQRELRELDDIKRLFGVTPEQIGDWVALVGDAADNVRGAPGIGPKKATALLQRFGTLGSVYEAVRHAPTGAEWAKYFDGDCCRLVGGEATYNSLLHNEDVVSLARRLVALRYDVPLPDVAAYVSATGEEEKSVVMEPPGDTGGQTREGDVMTEHVTQSIAREPQTEAALSAPVPVVPTELGALLQRPAQWERALEPGDSTGAVAVAGRLFRSRMFSAYGNEDAVLSTILLGRELGLGVMGSLRGIHVVEGRHALSADLMVALCLKSGLCEYFDPVELTAERATYRTKRDGRAEFQMSFSLEEAKQAGLVKEKSNWAKWPLDMCKARCVARLARAIYPDVCSGMYVPEEVES